MTAQDISPLQEAVLSVCDRYDELGGPAVRPATEYARRHLTDQLRLAVVGRVKAGKSTLVNAILGRRVAATDDVECTRIVTRYEFGPPPESALLHLSGDRPPVPLALQSDGSLPRNLGYPVEEISHIVVRLHMRALRDFTLIDTPGLSTTTAENEAATRAHVLGVDGVRQADAVLYVFRGDQHRDDVEFLREFRRQCEGTSSSGAIGVLSNADNFGKGAWGDDDPLPAAASRAAELASDRSAELATVVSVAGRLGESGAVGDVTESDARHLAALAGLTDFQLQAGRLPDSIDDATFRRLDHLLGEYGLRYGRAVARHGATSLIRWMDDVSGVAGLRQALARQYVGRYPQLKAKVAMEQLERAVYGAPDPMALKRMLSGARLHPDLHPLEEVRAWELLTARHDAHPLIDMLDRLLTARSDEDRVGLTAGAPADQVRRRAAELSDRAKYAAVGGDSAAEFAAQTVATSYSLVATRQRRG